MYFWLSFTDKNKSLKTVKPLQEGMLFLPEKVCGVGLEISYRIDFKENFDFVKGEFWIRFQPPSKPPEMGGRVH